MVPLKERGLHCFLSKSKPKVEDELCDRDRKKLPTLKDVANVVFNKSKTNLDLGVREDETSDMVTGEMIKKEDQIS